MGVNKSFTLVLCMTTSVPRANYTLCAIVQPSDYSCFAIRVLPPFSLTMMYAPLLVKTVRIARILGNIRSLAITPPKRFLSSTSQVVFTCILIFIQVRNRQGSTTSSYLCGDSPRFLPTSGRGTEPRDCSPGPQENEFPSPSTAAICRLSSSPAPS